MKTRPIIFSEAMVRAILDNRKTQTRRIILKPHADWSDPSAMVEYGPPDHLSEFHRDKVHWFVGCDEDRDSYPNNRRDSFTCPFGKPGDQLWVREAFAHVASGSAPGEVRYGITYRADSATIWNEHTTKISFVGAQPEPSGPMQFRRVKWKPSIHMPRHACRINLEIVAIKVERLQDISEPDARAEGVVGGYLSANGGAGWISNDKMPDVYKSKWGFKRIWDEINSSRLKDWKSNPWVWVIEFRRLP